MTMVLKSEYGMKKTLTSEVKQLTWRELSCLKVET